MGTATSKAPRGRPKRTAQLWVKTDPDLQARFKSVLALNGVTIQTAVNEFMRKTVDAAKVGPSK